VFGLYGLHLSFKLAIAFPTLFNGTVSQEFRMISCQRDTIDQGLHPLSGENCKLPLKKYFFLLILPISNVADQKLLGSGNLWVSGSRSCVFEEIKRYRYVKNLV
jgi:hypothetical protein